MYKTYLSQHSLTKYYFFRPHMSGSAWRSGPVFLLFLQIFFYPGPLKSFRGFWQAEQRSRGSCSCRNLVNSKAWGSFIPSSSACIVVKCTMKGLSGWLLSLSGKNLTIERTYLELWLSCVTTLDFLMQRKTNYDIQTNWKQHFQLYWKHNWEFLECKIGPWVSML